MTIWHDVSDAEATTPRLPTVVRSPGSVPAPASPPTAARPSIAPSPLGPLADRWRRQYAALVISSDLLLAVSCVLIGILSGLRFDATSPAALQARVVSGVVAGLLVVAALFAARAWDSGVLGAGPEEFRRVSRAVVGGAVALALGGLALQIESVRPWVFLVLPAYGGLCLLARYGLRKMLHRERRAGRFMLPVLAVGDEAAVADLIARTQRDQYFGWEVTGACTPTGLGTDGGAAICGVPVVGDLDAVGAAVRAHGYRVVAVAPAPGWGPARLQTLAWELEDTPSELAVDPRLMEIAGPRLHITPVDGLPMLRLSQPRFTGATRVVKGAIDRVAAALLLLLVAPVVAAIAFAVRLDGGPAFFFQERVGVGGRTFRMVKFRSMVVDADRHVGALAATNEGAGPLFKMRRDPRITRVGAFLRRYSLDELPQLFNVLAGSMSLVGPRPPLPREVATYGRDAWRRLLVRPGMTGLWQVSGRSDLSWEETIRLDLRYVENWSLAVDATILWKTIGAIVKGRGAY